MWSTENIRFCEKHIEKQPETSQNSLFSAVFWSKWRDSNSRPPVPETGALPAALHLVINRICYNAVVIITHYIRFVNDFSKNFFVKSQIMRFGSPAFAVPFKKQLAVLPFKKHGQVMLEIRRKSARIFKLLTRHPLNASLDSFT